MEQGGGDREKQLGQQLLQMMMQNSQQNQATSDTQLQQMIQTLQQNFDFQIESGSSAQNAPKRTLLPDPQPLLSQPQLQPLLPNPPQSNLTQSTTGVQQMLNSFEARLRSGSTDASAASQLGAQLNLLQGDISRLLARSTTPSMPLMGMGYQKDTFHSGFNQGGYSMNQQSGPAGNYSEYAGATSGNYSGYSDSSYSGYADTSYSGYADDSYSGYAGPSGNYAGEGYGMPQQYRNRRRSDIVDGDIIVSLGRSRWRCTVCRVHFSSWMDLIEHCDPENPLHAANKLHRRKRWSKGSRSDEREYSSTNPRLADTYRGTKRGGASDGGGGGRDFSKRPRTLYCSICEVECNSATALREHREGKNHATKVGSITVKSKEVENTGSKKLNVNKYGVRKEHNTDEYLVIVQECGVVRTNKLTSIEELMAYEQRISCASRVAQVLKLVDSADYDLCLLCYKKLKQDEQEEHLKTKEHEHHLDWCSRIAKWISLFTELLDPATSAEASKLVDTFEIKLCATAELPCYFCGTQRTNPGSKHKPISHVIRKHFTNSKHMSIERIVRTLVVVAKAVKEEDGFTIWREIKKNEKLLFNAEIKPASEHCNICQFDLKVSDAHLRHNTSILHNHSRYYLEELVIGLQPLKELDYVKTAKLQQEEMSDDDTVAMETDGKSCDDLIGDIDQELKGNVASVDDCIKPCFYCSKCQTFFMETYTEHCQTEGHLQAAEEAEKGNESNSPQKRGGRRKSSRK